MGMKGCAIMAWPSGNPHLSEEDDAFWAEAERLGIEAILEAPVAADETRRAATNIVPVIPEVELDLAG